MFLTRASSCGRLFLFGVVLGVTTAGVRVSGEEVAGPTATEILQRIWLGAGGVTDLQWEAEIDVTWEKQPPVWLTVHYAVKWPDKLRVWVVARRTHPDAWDDFEHKVGMVLILNGQRLIRYQPFLEKVLITDLSQPLPPADNFSYEGTGGMPNIVPYVQALAMLWREESADHASLVGREVVDGADCYVLEWTYPQPLKPREPHAIGRRCQWIDAEKFVVRREVQWDAAGQTISTTVFSQIVPAGEGHWTALHAETVIAPGTVRAKHDMQVSWGNDLPHQETWEAEVAYGGRRMVREFQLLAGGLRVPRQTLLYDEAGRILFRSMFHDFRANANLPDALFEYPVPEERAVEEAVRELGGLAR